MSLTPRLDRLDRNYIINGNFDFWQRGTSFNYGSTTLAGGYQCDRFKGDFSSFTNSTVVFSRSTDVPNSDISTYSKLTTVTSAGTLNTASYLLPCSQLIEGNIFRYIHKKKVTLSFFIKSSNTGTFPVAFRNAANDRSYVTTFTVNTANVWEKKVINLTLDQSGAWNLSTGVGLVVLIGAYAGSTYQSPSANTWVSGQYASLPGCTNWFTNGSTMAFSQVQLVEGMYDDPDFNLAGGNLIQELILCQRYYEKTYAVDTTPGTATQSGALFTVSSGTGLGNVVFNFQYKVEKRPGSVAPTIYNPVTGNIGSCDRNGTPINAISLSTGTTAVAIRNDATTTDNTGHNIHVVVESEL